MQVYLVVGEHYSVPGIITKAFDSLSKAKQECVDLVNIMLEDMKLPHADLANWEGCLAMIQDIHGAEHCHVGYDKLPVG